MLLSALVASRLASFVPFSLVLLGAWNDAVFFTSSLMLFASYLVRSSVLASQMMGGVLSVLGLAVGASSALVLPVWMLDTYRVMLVFALPIYACLEAMQIARIVVFYSNQLVRTLHSLDSYDDDDQCKATLLKALVMVYSFGCFAVTVFMSVQYVMEESWWVAVAVIACTGALVVLSVMAEHGVISEPATIGLALANYALMYTKGVSLCFGMLYACGFVESFASASSNPAMRAVRIIIDLVLRQPDQTTGAIGLSADNVVFLLNLIVSLAFTTAVLWSLGLNLWFEHDDEEDEEEDHGNQAEQQGGDQKAEGLSESLDLESIVKAGLVLLLSISLAQVFGHPLLRLPERFPVAAAVLGFSESGALFAVQSVVCVVTYVIVLLSQDGIAND